MTAHRWPPRTLSAVAALVWSSKPTATNAEIRSALQQTAQDLGTAGRDNYYGYGLVQAKAAIDALTSIPPHATATPTGTATFPQPPPALLPPRLPALPPLPQPPPALLPPRLPTLLQALRLSHL